jgi:outer membrane protein
MFSVSQFSAIAVAAIAVSALTIMTGAAAPAQTPGGGPITLPAAAGSSTGSLPPPQILVVNVEGIIKQSKAMIGLQAQIDAQNNIIQKDVAKTEDELQAAKQELAKEQGVLSPDSFEEKRHAFEKRFTEWQKETQAKQQSLRQGAQDAFAKVSAKLREIVSEIADRRHSNLVLQNNAILVVDPAYEVSAEVLEALNKNMPEVKLVLSKPTETPGGQAPVPQNVAKKK